MLSRNIGVVLGIDTCASDELVGIAQTANTSLYQQLVTFLNAKAMGLCSDPSDNTYDCALDKEECNESRGTLVSLLAGFKAQCRLLRLLRTQQEMPSEPYVVTYHGTSREM